MNLGFRTVVYTNWIAERGLNIGAISGIATTFLELRYGFWAAFLLPLCGLWIAPTTLVLGRKVFSNECRFYIATCSVANMLQSV